MENFLINENAERVIGIGKSSKLSDIVTVAFNAGVGITVALIVLGLVVAAGGVVLTSSQGNFQGVSKYKSEATKYLGVLLAMIAVLSVGYLVLPNFGFLDLSSEKRETSTPRTALTGPVSTGTAQNVSSPSCGNPEQVKTLLSSNGNNVCTGTKCNKTCTFTPQIERIVREESSKANVDANIIFALICRESSGNPEARGTLANNGRPDCGLMQINSTACTPEIMDPATNVRLGITKYKSAYSAVSSYSYPNIQKQSLAFAAYNCCAGGDNPNSKSADCNTSTGWGNDLPKWACPVNPGNGVFNMCAVKNYACTVSACAAYYAEREL